MWLDDDRDWVLAWQLDEKSKLPCGCYPDDTVGPDHDDKFTVEMIVCEKHRSIGEAAERWHKQANDADVRHGLLWMASS